VDSKKLLTLSAFGAGAFLTYKAFAKPSPSGKFAPDARLPDVTGWRSQLASLSKTPMNPNWVRDNVDPGLRWDSAKQEMVFSPQGQVTLLKDYILEISNDINRNVKCPDGFEWCGNMLSDNLIQVPGTDVPIVVDYRVCASLMTLEELQDNNFTLKREYDLETTVSPSRNDGTAIPESDFLPIYRSVLLVPRIRPPYALSQFWEGKRVFANPLDPDWTLLIDHTNFTLDMQNDDSEHDCIGYIDEANNMIPDLNGIWLAKRLNAGGRPITLRSTRPEIAQAQAHKLLNAPKPANPVVKAQV